MNDLVNRNALAVGMAGHAAAVLIGMMTVAGADTFFTIVYPFSWIALVLGTYAGLKAKGFTPLKTWRFSIASIAALIPIIGLLTTLIVLRARKSAPAQKLKASPLVLALFILLLAVLFIFIAQQRDPYFKAKGPQTSERRI